MPSTTIEHVVAQGSDFFAKFAGLGAGIVGIALGKQTRAKLERKRLDKTTGFSSPSSVVKVEDIVITVEKDTGDIPPLRSPNGPLVIYDKCLLKKRTYADAYLYDIGQEKYEQETQVTIDLTFAINSEPVETTWDPVVEPIPVTGYTTTTA